MRKNTTGQSIGFKMLSTTDGSVVTTGTPTVYITGDGGTQSTGTGTAVHEGNGDWTYTPSQAETNFDHILFSMSLTGAFGQSVNIYPTYPQTEDNATKIDLLITEVQSGGYENGMIWINTIGGSSGSTPYVNGTVAEPVNNWADALILSIALNIKAFFIVGASSITLSGNSDGFRFYGNIYTINLNGQSVSGTFIDGGYVVGNDDGSNTIPTIYQNCRMAGQTLGQYLMRDCRVEGNITFAESGTYDHHESSFMGTSIQIDYGALIGSVTSVFHGCAGNISLLNMGQVITDIIRVAGIGEVAFAASCVGGTAYISGVTNITDSSGGAVAINYDANIPSLISDLNNLSSGEVDTALTNYGANTTTPPTTTEIVTSIDVSSTQIAAIKASTDKVDDTLEDDAGTYRFTANALEEAPSGTGGDATAANQTTIISHLTDVKGVTWSGTTDSLEAIRDRGDVAWLTGAGGSSPTVAEIRTEMDDNSTKLAAIVEDTGTTIPTQISGLNNIDSSDVTTACSTSLTAYDGPTKAELDSAFTEIKGATWSNVTDTLENIRDKQTDIELDTGTDIPNQITALNNISTSDVNTQALAAMNTYDGPTKAELDAAFSALNDPTLQEIANAVLDDVLPDIAAGGVDIGQDMTLRKVGRALLNRFYREVVQTSTTQTVKNDSSIDMATMPASEIAGVSQTKGAAT